jgi:hypothetical protein
VGVIVDTAILVTAERRRNTVAEIFSQIERLTAIPELGYLL